MYSGLCELHHIHFIKFVYYSYYLHYISSCGYIPFLTCSFAPAPRCLFAKEYPYEARHSIDEWQQILL
ncbi:hypothetical protein EB796_010339 [Bugula neritina]|uniref:Uncharacterized protein n=1 Tax=Bugula neritina TaxID=10212 RepID=A0A7J7JY74_BUGNE|nr:hypothetical protein EB796_010339 [Bugula neritina]